MAGKRSIFEEVGDRPQQPIPPAGGLIDARPKGARGAVRLWLVVLALMVVAMIVIGGLTRLSDAGLSITEWRPVTGAIPPMDAAAWTAEFEKYRATPQFALANPDMTVEEFKTIYWWEWGHRQLGRAIGAVWALGFLWFLARRRIPPGWTGRLLLVGALGGLQGAIGWWMVASGLTGSMVSVAPYRLAVHLGLGFAILGLLASYAMQLGRTEAQLMTARRAGERRIYGLATGLMHFAFLQILLGALVAGTDAGRSYTEWPLMGGAFFPPTGWDLSPLWRNLFENPGTVQFLHRIAGYLLLAFGLVAWTRGRRSAHATTRTAFHLVLAVLVAQLVLGIVTVLTAAHLHLAITHQIGAVILWVLVLRARHLAQYPVAGSIREGTA